MPSSCHQELEIWVRLLALLGRCTGSKEIWNTACQVGALLLLSLTYCRFCSRRAGSVTSALLPAAHRSSEPVQLFLASTYLTSQSWSSFSERALSFRTMPGGSSRKLNPLIRIELSTALTSSSNRLSSIWALFWKGKFPRRRDVISQQTLVRLVTKKE